MQVVNEGSTSKSKSCSFTISFQGGRLQLVFWLPFSEPILYHILTQLVFLILALSYDENESRINGLGEDSCNKNLAIINIG